MYFYYFPYTIGYFKSFPQGTIKKNNIKCKSICIIILVSKYVQKMMLPDDKNLS